jgi:hypothetical protein
MADIRLATISTKILPLDIVLPLFACVFLFFLFSKEYRGKFFTVPVLLLVLWTLVPAVSTQGYLVGLYTDYNRFLYFVIFPVITLIGLGIDHGSVFFARLANWLVLMAKELPQVRASKNKTLSRILPYLIRKNFLTAFILIFVLTAFLSVPVFVTPSQGITVQMNNPLFEGIQWAQKNTPTDSVFITDALYGWWFSGFAQRPTLSAVDPQYLTLANEFEPARVARNVLDTDYLVDNGLIQIREDGGYIGRHNPIFLAKLNNSYFPYPFFHFNNNEITVEIREGNGNIKLFDLSQIPVQGMHIENDTSFASIYVTRTNQFFNFTQKATIYQGIRFVNMTETIESNLPEVTLNTVRFILHTKGLPVEGENATVVGYLDKNMKVAGQLIFTEGQPETNVLTSENPSCLDILYNLNGTSAAELKFSVGVYQFKPEENLTLSSPEKLWLEYGKELLTNNTKTYMQTTPNLTLDVFNYQQALSGQNVSYVAVRDIESVPRFAKDPQFSLVFINNEVAIFQVRNNLR